MFDDENTNAANEPETFTIGDKQYTQEELNNLVSLGEKAAIIEKDNGGLDKVMTDWGRTRAELGDLRKKVAEFESRDQATRAQAGQLTRDEILAKIQEEASSVGLVTAKNAPEIIEQIVESNELKRYTDDLVDELADMNIEADRDVVIRFMDAADISDPQEAIEKLYGPQIKMWQEQELAKGKPDDWATNTVGGAGSYKLPDGVKINRETSQEDLINVFREAAGIPND